MEPEHFQALFVLKGAKNVEDLDLIKKAQAKVIKRNRQRMGWTQAQMGFYIYKIPETDSNINKAQQRVKMIESGRQALRITDFEKYANAFGKSSKKLFEEIHKEYEKFKM